MSSTRNYITSMVIVLCVILVGTFWIDITSKNKIENSSVGKAWLGGSLSYINYDNHLFIMTPSGNGILHHPDCPCKKIVGKE